MNTETPERAERAHPVIRQRTLSAIGVVSLALGMTVVLHGSASATTCSPVSGSYTTVNGGTNDSNFEVDDSANLTQDGSSPCIDWNSSDVQGATPAPERGDKPSGPNDNSFGKGTSEDNATPTVVTGSIPPKKSDLTHFGVYEESPSTGGHFVALNWARANNPSGTTNMDFELNKKFCDYNASTGTEATGSHCSNNHVTPQRTSGDKLIQYDLASGGTSATISYRTWDGSAWGAATALDSTEAAGTVNTTAIDADANALLPGGQDAYTFGEAVFDLDSVLGTCGNFGSVYLKSRSSTSFTSEIKDFISPKKVQISNCPSSVATSQSFYPNDSATVTGGTTGTVTFTLFDSSNGSCTLSGAPVVGTDGVVYTETVDLSTADSNGAVHTSNTSEAVTAADTYKWLVSYSGGGVYTASTSPCGTEQFTLDVTNG